ncbi:MAG: DUF465 domain-containing protein [Micavibrio sp.]|mgnify:FL=1|nr:DUF465 domain-containing protein [Micavibrio sp.]|tara:strand:- start:181 stop:369 length:189 start_codon:yes stop_codon:yes gene_type:complete
MSAIGLEPSHHNHLKALENRHAALEERIRDEEKRPLPSDFVLKRLKRNKLELKDLIERERLQ